MCACKHMLEAPSETGILVTHDAHVNGMLTDRRIAQHRHRNGTTGHMVGWLVRVIVSARTFITMISITLMGKLEQSEHKRIHVLIVLSLALPLSRESRKRSPLVDGRSP